MKVTSLSIVSVSWLVGCNLSKTEGNSQILAEGKCIVQKSNGTAAEEQNDPLFEILKQNQCPTTVSDFKKLLLEKNLTSLPSMVANRGFHNPEFGSFSFFETVSGTLPSGKSVASHEFMFGHFTGEDSGKLVLDEAPSPRKLMIELIVWDSKKQVYNFYELIGKAGGSTWFYRGDSLDILKDNEMLLLPNSGPAKPSTLRCSACHTSGGPIMKELKAPHNDWWTTARKLPLGTLTPDEKVSQTISSLQDASDFAQSVKAGIAALETSPTYQAQKQKGSLPSQLKPLFCTVEINLESDVLPLDESQATVQVPTAAVTYEKFADSGSVTMKKSVYLEFLKMKKLKFPEINRPDGDHAFLVPVKSHSDLLAIETLINQGIITQKWADSLLSFDLENPLFPKTCELLKYVPKQSTQWELDFVKALESSGDPLALDLKTHIQNFDSLNLKQKTADLLSQWEQNLSSVTTALPWLQTFLLNKRNSVFTNEISQNPMGQILEPGFRVIFPK